MGMHNEFVNAIINQIKTSGRTLIGDISIKLDVCKNQCACINEHPSREGRELVDFPAFFMITEPYITRMEC